MSAYHVRSIAFVLQQPLDRNSLHKQHSQQLGRSSVKLETIVFKGTSSPPQSFWLDWWHFLFGEYAGGVQLTCGVAIIASQHLPVAGCLTVLDNAISATIVALSKFCLIRELVTSLFQQFLQGLHSLVILIHIFVLLCYLSVQLTQFISQTIVLRTQLSQYPIFLQCILFGVVMTQPQLTN